MTAHIKQTKAAVFQMALYLEKAYIQSGLSSKEAKEKVAKDLFNLSQTYLDIKLTISNKSGILSLLSRTIQLAEGLGARGITIKSNLVTIKQMLEADESGTKERETSTTGSRRSNNSGRNN